MKKGFTPTPKIKSQDNQKFLVRGFTLIEVVVVIGIIAVLTVIIFPAINNIRAKNRDAERVADIGTLQLGLSLYKSQNVDGVYPSFLQDKDFSPKYVPADALIGPDGELYTYVPLMKNSDKCTYYHLGVTLELPSAQIDIADTFSTLRGGGSEISLDASGYDYCVGYFRDGLAPGGTNYNVHP